VGPVGRFARGFGYGLEGLRWLGRHPHLSRYWLPPVVVTIALFVALQVLAVRFYPELRDMLWKGSPEDACRVSAWYSWACVLRAAYWVSGMIAWLLAAGAAMIVTLLMSLALSAPFNDALSEAVERERGVRRGVDVSLGAIVRDAARSLRLEALKLGAYLGLMTPLLVVSWLVPGVGQVLYVGVGGLLTVSYLALEFVDWSASRREWSVRRRFALLREHPSLLLGFGACVWGLLFVPVLGWLLMPAAVIGGTLLFLDLEQSGSLPSSAADDVS